MFKRRISTKDIPGVLNAMGNDLDSTRVMVMRMEEWAAETAGLGSLAAALGGAVVAIEDAHEAAHRAHRAAIDEEARDR